jgi:ornithine decarboxylase
MTDVPLAKTARIRRNPILVVNTLQPSTPVLKYPSVADLVEKRKPLDPVHVLRPHAIKAATKFFLTHFPGNVMYAVKTNPEPRALKTIAKTGIKHFDVASLAEVELVASEVRGAQMYFMHPVKSREAIAKAYFQYKVRDFALDSLEELQKIVEMTHHAKDLHLHVRLAVGNEHAALSLHGKFGVAKTEAVELLKAVGEVAQKIGLCFHVGSQCMNPESYRDAIAFARQVADEAGVAIASLDVGGGFPSIYPDLTPPDLMGYMETIRAALSEFGFNNGTEVFCEPGRALVAEAGSILVRVELRKGNMLYINDGIYGSLFDAGFPGFTYPVRAFRPMEPVSGELMAFSFFGPTCDSMDAMKGPFLLPSDIKEGDWIEIGGLGAYGQTMRTKFNGFYSDIQADVHDAPMLSLFGLN